MDNGGVRRRNGGQNCPQKKKTCVKKKTANDSDSNGGGMAGWCCWVLLLLGLAAVGLSIGAIVQNSHIYKKTKHIASDLDDVQNSVMYGNRRAIAIEACRLAIDEIAEMDVEDAKAINLLLLTAFLPEEHFAFCVNGTLPTSPDDEVPVISQANSNNADPSGFIVPASVCLRIVGSESYSSTFSALCDGSSPSTAVTSFCNSCAAAA